MKAVNNILGIDKHKFNEENMTDNNQEFMKVPVLYPNNTDLIGLVSRINEKFKDSPSDRPDLLNFEGIVDVHGTRTAVVLWDDGTVVAQQSTSDDGWASWVESQGDLYWIEMLGDYIPNDENSAVILYGKWVQNKAFIVDSLQSAICKKGAYDVETQWLYDDFTMLEFPNYDTLIFHTEEFKTFQLTIDINDVKSAIGPINSMLVEVATNWPGNSSFSKIYGQSPVSEGIIWRCVDEGFENSDWWFNSSNGMKTKI